jgi:hypothetical protein
VAFKKLFRNIVFGNALGSSKIVSHIFVGKSRSGNFAALDSFCCNGSFKVFFRKFFCKSLTNVFRANRICGRTKLRCNIFDGVLTERTDSNRTRIEAAGGKGL